MSGGTISGNSTDSLGGGVYNSGTFNMSGGAISGNTAGTGNSLYGSGAAKYAAPWGTNNILTNDGYTMPYTNQNLPSAGYVTVGH
jgi:hypothetical protein